MAAAPSSAGWTRPRAGPVQGRRHVAGDHSIEFDGADHARGVLYSRNEHETGGGRVIMAMLYFDLYERIAGRWLFRRRLPLY